MSQFTADIAGILEIAVIAAGLITLYFANKEQSGLLKGAAWLMIIGGIAIGLCTSYWWFKYHSSGYFNNPSSIIVTSIPEDNTVHHYHPEDTKVDAQPGDMHHPYPKD